MDVHPLKMISIAIDPWFFNLHSHCLLLVLSNVNPGLINPKRLFNWGGTISVAIDHYLGEPPQLSGVDITKQTPILDLL